MTVTLEDIPEWARAVDWPALQPTPIPNDASSAWAIHRDGVRLRVAEGCHFYVAADGRSISAEWTDEIAFADICGYLLGTVIGYALRRLGVLTLHASGVVVDGRVLAFVGESGAGKSTTAMAFASVGAAVLTDDVFAVRDFEGRPHAFPSFDHLRVTREAAVPFIGESAGSLALVGPTWDKYLLHPVAAGFARAEQPAPVAAIILLDSRDPAASAATIRRASARSCPARAWDATCMSAA